MLTLEQKLEEHRVMAADLKRLKADEMELRIDIAEQLSSDGLAAGTHNFAFEGLKVKLVSKLNYRIDKDILETLELTEEEAECIRWKPELNLTKYKMEEIDTLDEAIIVTTGAPTLTVELAE